MLSQSEYLLVDVDPHTSLQTRANDEELEPFIPTQDGLGCCALQSVVEVSPIETDHNPQVENVTDDQDPKVALEAWAQNPDLAVPIEHMLAIVGLREKNVLKLRYGFLDARPLSVSEIASVLGIKQSAVASTLYDGRRKALTIVPQIANGSFDYSTCFTSSNSQLNVLTFMVRAGLPICSDIGIKDLERAANKYLEGLSDISARHKSLIQDRFGLNGTEPIELSVLADKYGTNQATLSNQIRSAIAKIAPGDYTLATPKAVGNEPAVVVGKATLRAAAQTPPATPRSSPPYMGTPTHKLISRIREGYPILKAEEEVALGQQIQASIVAQRQLETMAGDDSLDPALVNHLRTVIRTGQEARKTMVLSNISLVAWVANRYFYRSPLEFEDLVQEGIGATVGVENETILGLIQAIEKFDPNKGVKFSVYAIPWIRLAMRRGIDNHGRAIRIPSDITDRHKEFNELLEAAPNAGAEYIAKMMEITVPKAQRFLDAHQMITMPVKSLATPLNDEGDLTLDDVIKGSITTDEGDPAEKTAISIAIDGLPGRQRAAIRLMFGFVEGQGDLSQQEVAQKLGYTVPALRQDIHRALMTLKKELGRDFTLAA